jgi:predicted CoA-binding protein
MAKNSIESIRQFIDHKEFAFIGMSRDEKKFSRAVFKELSKKGFKMYPVNPQMNELDGARCYQSISELPYGLTNALIMTPKEATESAIEQAYEHGIRNIWI